MIDALGGLPNLAHLLRSEAGASAAENHRPENTPQDTPSVQSLLGRFGPLPAGLAPLPVSAAERSLESPALDSARRGPLQNLDAQSFGRLSAQRFEAAESSALSFELTTQDGDRITFQFEQLDYQRYAEAGGNSEAVALTERAVTMSVVGDLSSDELAAIDQAIASVTDLAGRFFGGDLSQPAAVLAGLDIDAGQLAEFSLNLTQTQSAELTRVFEPAANRLSGIAARQPGVGELLEQLGEGQRRFIDSLSQVLDAPSAVGLARGIVPELISPSVI